MMKIKYESTIGKPVEIEVSDEWREVLIELDRQEYNINHKETRRHTSLDGLDYEGEWFVTENDIDELLIQSELSQSMREAVHNLNQAQQELISAVFFQGISISEYAKLEGVSQSAVSQRLITALKKLKKLL
jgi:RNA polymerase sigma factor (sigma-70 family)